MRLVLVVNLRLIWHFDKIYCKIKIERSFQNYLIKNMIKKNYLLLIIIAIVIITVLCVLCFINKDHVEEIVEEEELPAEVTSLAQGKQTYFIETGEPKNLQIIQVDLDPLDVKIKETQVLTVIVKDAENNPITKENKVEAIIFTDNTSTTVPFKLIQADGPDLTTIWEGSWTAEDTHDIIYSATITATNSQTQSFIDLSFR